MKYLHADVFSNKSLQGNGLTIIFTDSNDTNQLQEIAKEFKQFETVFIYGKEAGYYPIRIFTVDEELDFAGHPILGAAAAVLKETGSLDSRIKFKTGNRIVENRARCHKGYYSVIMNQGQPDYKEVVSQKSIDTIVRSLNLVKSELSETLPMEVVSTGLDYLIIPVKDEESLAKSRILTDDFEEQLRAVSAKFVYLVNPQTMECRTWDNQGLVEDVATGSAAGPLCAYLIRQGKLGIGEKVRIRQGKYAGRPSEITAWMDTETSDIHIEGDVKILVEGELNL